MPISFIKNTRTQAIIEGEFGQIFFGRIYRFMDQEGILKTLHNKTLRFTTLDALNDPLEGNLKLLNIDEFEYAKLSLSRKKHITLQILFHFLKSIYPKKEIPVAIQEALYKHFNDSDIATEQVEQIDTSLKSLQTLLTSKMATDENFRNEYFRELGLLRHQIKVCCFSRNFKNKNSSLMWSHYAEGHSGACLEFDFVRYLKGLNQEPEIEEKFRYLKDNNLIPFMVNYQRIKTKLNIYENEEDYYKWICTKDSKWKYEQEVRMIHSSDISDSQTFIELPRILFSKVIFGVKADDQFQNRVINLAKQEWGNVRFEKIYIDDRDQLMSRRIQV